LFIEPSELNSLFLTASMAAGLPSAALFHLAMTKLKEQLGKADEC
jgi:hypothetical protein